MRSPILQIWLVLIGLLAGLSMSCGTREGQQYDLIGQDVALTIIHTSDIHSRLLPYDLDVRITDENLGLNPETGPYGGIARLAYLIKRERADSGRSILLDSGDPFQGAPIFNAFQGEVEFRAMSLLNYDAMVIGNHEFDSGLANLINQIKNWVNFPLVVSNYHYLDRGDPGAESLGDYTVPFTVVNRDGLIIGIIGIGSLDGIVSLGFGDNSVRIQPLQSAESLQYYINLLQPQVNVIIGLSHAGLDDDYKIISETVGLDVMMGGHLHIVLDPPRLVPDAAGRNVILCHSGAFLKYMGRLDLVLRGREEDPHDFEVVSHRYELFPIDSTVPEDPDMLRLLEPYAQQLRQLYDLTRVIAYAPKRLERYGLGGGDSPLGNFVADTIRLRRRVETDFAVNNTLGIRSDVVQGPIIMDHMFNIFPFPNSITTMTLSGNEVQELLDYNARRSATRGCVSQLQASGISFVNDCSVYPAVARDIRIQDEPLVDSHFYTMATNDYIARGGSGFQVLQFNNTQQDTGITIRDAIVDSFQAQPSCFEMCADEGKTPDECEILYGCAIMMYQFYSHHCQGLETFSDQDRCLDWEAPECLEESDVSDWQICRASGDRSCEWLYRAADREACYEAYEPNCEEFDRVSPREACTIENFAEHCLEESATSPYEACHEESILNGEEICLSIPCVDAASDGRITRILPSNEYVPTDEPGYGGDDATYLMEYIQDVMGDEESGW